jgi:hypothetical protein
MLNVDPSDYEDVIESGDGRGPASKYIWETDPCFRLINLKLSVAEAKLHIESADIVRVTRAEQWLYFKHDPIVLVHVGSKYVLWDGTHRVCVALVRGIIALPALVGTTSRQLRNQLNKTENNIKIIEGNMGMFRCIPTAAWAEHEYLVMEWWRLHRSLKLPLPARCPAKYER